jgi:hypothetical protein
VFADCTAQLLKRWGCSPKRAKKAICSIAVSSEFAEVRRGSSKIISRKQFGPQN